MSRSRLGVALLGALALALAPAVARAESISSTFRAGLEGWTITGDVQPGSPYWVSTGGNPNGFAQAVDSATGDLLMWSAPAKFLGDRSAYYGGTLRFDREVTPGSPFVPDSDVILSGAGHSVHFTLASAPGASWTRQQITLLPSQTSDGTSEATLRAVLADLTSVLIEGEYVNGGETDSLDNVVLKTPLRRAPKISSANTVKLKEGVAHTFKVRASGEPTPSLDIDGTLPDGLTFTDNGDGTGALSGTPAAGSAGTYTVAVTATNSVGSKTQALTINVYQVPKITSLAHTKFTIGRFNSFTVTATGVPVPVLTETKPLPDGITFVDNGDGTGTLSGTPTGSPQSWTLGFKAKNPGGGVTQRFTLKLIQ